MSDENNSQKNQALLLFAQYMARFEMTQLFRITISPKTFIITTETNHVRNNHNTQSQTEVSKSRGGARRRRVSITKKRDGHMSRVGCAVQFRSRSRRHESRRSKG